MAKAGNKPNNKRTHEEQEALIKLGAQWLYENPTAPQGAFVKWIMAEAGLSTKKMAYEYRKRSYKIVHELQDVDIESKRTLRVSALQKMFDQAQQENDTRLALQVLQELNKVDNLYVHKVEQTEVKDIPMFDLDKPVIKLKKAE